MTRRAGSSAAPAAARHAAGRRPAAQPPAPRTGAPCWGRGPCALAVRGRHQGLQVGRLARAPAAAGAVRLAAWWLLTGCSARWPGSCFGRASLHRLLQTGRCLLPSQSGLHVLKARASRSVQLLAGTAAPSRRSCRVSSPAPDCSRYVGLADEQKTPSVKHVIP